MNLKIRAGLAGLILLQLLTGVVWFGSVPEAQAISKSNQIVFKPMDMSSLPDILKKYNLTNSVMVADDYVRADVPANTDATTLTDSMNADSTNIAASSPNGTVSFLESGNRFHFDFSQLGGSASPTSLATQWAWSKTKLSAGQKKSTGQGIKVAVLDTGVEATHPLLAGKVLAGFDAINQLADGADVNGHGTFVAGVIAQVAPDAQIMPVRVLDANGVGILDNVLTGFKYALDNGAQIINLSFSTIDDLKPLHNLIIKANAKGVIVVAAAGNDASGNPYYPAAYDELLTVSSTDQNDFQAPFANFGNFVDLSSPGVDIFSAWLNGGYAGGSGTSFSAPTVAGATAMVLNKHPGSYLNIVKNYLQKAAVGFAPGCKCKGMGKGRLDFSFIK